MIINEATSKNKSAGWELKFRKSLGPDYGNIGYVFIYDPTDTTYNYGVNATGWKYDKLKKDLATERKSGTPLQSVVKKYRLVKQEYNSNDFLDYKNKSHEYLTKWNEFVSSKNAGKVNPVAREMYNLSKSTMKGKIRQLRICHNEDENYEEVVAYVSDQVVPQLKEIFSDQDVEYSEYMGSIHIYVR